MNRDQGRGYLEGEVMQFRESLKVILLSFRFECWFLTNTCIWLVGLSAAQGVQ